MVKMPAKGLICNMYFNALFVQPKYNPSYFRNYWKPKLGLLIKFLLIVMYVNVFAYFLGKGFIIFCSFTVQLALRTFRCRLYQIPCHSQFVSQPRCSACSLYVEDSCPGGASGPRGYHIMRMMAPLSRVPSQKTRRAGAGLWVTGIQNMLHHTKDIRLVVLGWMSCRFKSEPFVLYPSLSRLNVTQAICGYPGDGQWLASDVVCIWQSRRRSWCLWRSETVKDKEADNCF